MTSRISPIKRVFRGRVRPGLNRAGWDLIKWPGITHPHMRSRILATHRIDHVLDVGANVGQFAADVRSFGYTGDITSFEPMAQAFADLSARAAADDRWQVVQSALGAEPGELMINVAGNSISSSLLPMLDRHAKIAPHSTYVRQEAVPVQRLDDVFSPADLEGRRVFLKIDTQGYESLILDGAPEVLAAVVGVELELSLVPLYEGQALMPELVERLAGQGLRLTELSPGLCDRSSGETLQVDGIFTRS